MRFLILLLALIPLFANSAEPEKMPETPRCSDVMEQMRISATYVGRSNYLVQFSRDKQARAILYLQQPSTNDSQMRWRLIERQLDSYDWCAIGQGNSFEPLMDLHLSKPRGKYGMPGSGLPRCAGEQENGLPGSLDIRMWANKELGNSQIYSLSNLISSRDFTVVFSTDNAGAWIILDSDRSNIDDTCYYDRGDSSKLAENFNFKDNL